MQNFLSNLALSNGEKVSQDALMEVIANSKEYEKTLTKAAKNGWTDNKEQIKLTEILQKYMIDLKKE